MLCNQKNHFNSLKGWFSLYIFLFSWYSLYLYSFMVVGFGFVVVFVCNTLQPWISHTKVYITFWENPFCFSHFLLLFFFIFHWFFHEKEKEMYFTRRSAVKWFCLCWLQNFMWCGFFFYFFYIKSFKVISTKPRAIYYILYKHVYKKKIIYQKKKHDKKKATNSLRTSLHSFSCRLFKTYVNILSRAFYYCLRSLSRSRNLTLKACSTAAAAKKNKENVLKINRKTREIFFLYINFVLSSKEYIWMFNVMRLLLDLSVDLWCCFYSFFL